MKPLPYVWPYALIFWGAFVWAFLPEFGVIARARGGPASERRDAGSMQVIILGTWVGMFVAIGIAWRPWGAMPETWRPAALGIGVALLIGGSLLRRHCFRMLGQFFTGDVRARADQPVIQVGAYGYVRHPSYTAGMLMFVGIGTALGNWASVGVLLASTLSAYLYRAHVEERALAESIGEPYREYMRTHKRFVPGVF